MSTFSLEQSFGGIGAALRDAPKLASLEYVKLLLEDRLVVFPPLRRLLKVTDCFRPDLDDLKHDFNAW